MKLYLEQEKKQSAPVIKLAFFKNGEEVATAVIDPKEIPAPQNTGELEVSYVKMGITYGNEIEWTKVPDKIEKLNWAHFKLPAEELDQNGVFLCSKDVSIQEVPYLKLKKGSSLEGFRYLTAIHGNVLDEEKHLSHAVDSFVFPSQKETSRSNNYLKP